MQKQLLKKCADSLRAFSHIKLKASHAHELVAAVFGYKSKNAMLADTKYPISNIYKAEIIVMVPDDAIDQRRKKLQGLQEELPDSYTLVETVYSSLVSDKSWQSPYPRFSSFEKAATYIVENTDQTIRNFFSNGDHPFQLIVDVNINDESVLLTVYHSYRKSSGEMECSGITTINLPRIAGYIGYDKPEMTVEKWTAGARRTLESLGVHHE